jgi:hypothetical protein
MTQPIDSGTDSQRFSDNQRIPPRDVPPPQESVEQDAERERGGPQSFGTSFLAEGKTDDAWRRWRELQGNFVDDPQNTVSQAHNLVSELIDDIVHRFESERGQLEQQWASGQEVSTEDLRHSFQRYRDFFGRLLANVSDSHH